MAMVNSIILNTNKCVYRTRTVQIHCAQKQNQQFGTQIIPPLAKLFHIL